MIAINGRFRSQNLTGVQRFASEITTALCRLRPGGVRLLLPGGLVPQPAAASGRLRGQFWEQLELPLRAGGEVLVNLGNLAPLLARRQLVVIHDAGIFAVPASYSRRFRLWTATLQKRLARRGVRIVTVSEFSRQEIARHLGIPAATIAVISEGADHIGRIATDPEALSAHALSTGRYVLVVGTLARHKNLAALDVLARRLAERDYTLAITGAFGAAAFNGTAGLPRPARYLGRVGDAALKTLLSAAACFVFPSLYEGFGLPAVEAMACGTPVVAADIPALRETCGEAALYADPRAPEAIADCVMGLLQDDDLRRRMIAAGARHVAPMTWDRAAGALDQVIGVLEAA